MVAETPRHVRGRLRHRSGPEPIGSTAESNQPYVLPLGADDTGSQITGPDTGRSLPPVMRAFCVLRARLPKDKHTVTATGVVTYCALLSHLAGPRLIGRGAFARDRGDPDGTSEAFRHTTYPNYATERSHWHLNAWRGPKAMDSLLADWFSTGRDLVWARVT